MWRKVGERWSGEWSRRRELRGGEEQAKRVMEEVGEAGRRK